MKKIAIVGAGWAGLAAAYYLSRCGAGLRITLYEADAIGAGASGIALGLLHPYAGARSSLNWRGPEGMAATLSLLQTVRCHLGRNVCRALPLLRLSDEAEQCTAWRRAAERYADITPYEGALPAGLYGITVRGAYLVDSPAYLEGLWSLCRQGGVVLEKAKIDDLDALTDYDAVLACCGAATGALGGLSHLPLRSVKGQLLELRTAAPQMPLPTPLWLRHYLLPYGEEGRWLVGGTFERDFASAAPQVATAQQLLLPPLQRLLPTLNEATIVGCRAGLRATAPGHRPLLQRVGPRCWVLSGLGSKGLLYHALYGAEAAQQISAATLS